MWVAKNTVRLKKLKLFKYIISSLCIHAATIFKFIATVLLFDFWRAMDHLIVTSMGPTPSSF